MAECRGNGNDPERSMPQMMTITYNYDVGILLMVKVKMLIYKASQVVSFVSVVLSAFKAKSAPTLW